MIKKKFIFFWVVVLTGLTINVNLIHAQNDMGGDFSDKEFVILEYPDVKKDYQKFALSFDSLFENADHTPDFHYYSEGSERLSSVHELINNAPDSSVIEIPEGEYTSQYFVMENRHDLVLKAKPGTVWLISDNSVSTIFYVVNCTNITIQGIGFLHKKGGFCTGNSIEISGSKNIILDSCDISGSGTIGVVASFVDGLTVKNSYVHHCTYQIMQLNNVRNAILFNNLFTNNRESCTITEGVSISCIWGKCILQNNSFYNNGCAALVFELLEQDGQLYPVGDGFVHVTRNLFYNNYSPAKSVSVFDIFCDESWGEYSVSAKDIVSFEENVFNTFTDVPPNEIDDVYMGEEYYIYPEKFIGDFNLDDNLFRDINNCGYSIETDSFIIGIHPSGINWLPFSRNPREN